VILPQVLAPYLGDCHLARPLENRKASS